MIQKNPFWLQFYLKKKKKNKAVVSNLENPVYISEAFKYQILKNMVRLAQQVKDLASKPGDPSLIPWTHMVGRREPKQSCPLTFTCMHP